MKSISPDLWIEIEKTFPAKEPTVERPGFDRYKAFSGILYILKIALYGKAYLRNMVVQAQFMENLCYGASLEYLKKF
jgi:hypothetical protein